MLKHLPKPFHMAAWLALALLPGLAQAQIMKCVGAGGRVLISETASEGGDLVVLPNVRTHGQAAAGSAGKKLATISPVGTSRIDSTTIACSREVPRAWNSPDTRRRFMCP